MHFLKKGKITRKCILHVTIINKYLTTVGENLCDVLLCSLRVAQQRHQMRNHSDVLKNSKVIMSWYKYFHLLMEVKINGGTGYSRHCVLHCNAKLPRNPSLMTTNSFFLPIPF